MQSVPIKGSRWVWEINNDYGRDLIEVEDVTNPTGKSILVTSRTMPTYGGEPTQHQTELSRFWRSVTPVGKTLAEMSELRVVSTEGNESC